MEKREYRLRIFSAVGTLYDMSSEHLRLEQTAELHQMLMSAGALEINTSLPVTLDTVEPVTTPKRCEGSADKSREEAAVDRRVSILSSSIKIPHQTRSNCCQPTRKLAFCA